MATCAGMCPEAHKEHIASCRAHPYFSAVLGTQTELLEAPKQNLLEALKHHFQQAPKQNLCGFSENQNKFCLSAQTLYCRGGEAPKQNFPFRAIISARKALSTTMYPQCTIAIQATRDLVTEATLAFQHQEGGGLLRSRSARTFGATSLKISGLPRQ